MEKTIFIDKKFSKEDIVKCVDELCSKGISKGCYDMEVLVYVLRLFEQIESFHDSLE